MSNLKKVVSLVLVLVMVFAMGASAMAAFTDAADINFVDEVNLLTALGILSGYPDGSFQPQGSVTRAEFAKMLFMVKLGHLDSSGFVNAASTFTDLEAAAWAKGFIKYLNSVGVVAGKSAASFDPNGQVTGYEAVKMLLVALGYKADQAGLVGENWKLNTLGLGQDRGILDGYNKDFDAPATRELACLLISNALDAVCVKYSGLSIDSTGGLTADVVDETRTNGVFTVLMTLGYKAFGLIYETGIVSNTQHLGLNHTDKGWFELGDIANTSGFGKGTDIDIKYDINELLFGQEVVVAFKEATNGDYVAYGVTVTGKSKVYESAIVDTKYDGTRATNDAKLTIKVDGTNKEFKNFADGFEANVIYIDDNSKINNISNRDIEKLFEAGTYLPDDTAPVFGKNLRLPGTVYVIDTDGNGRPDEYVVLGSAFGRVDTYSDSKFTLLGTGLSLTLEDDDLKKISGDFKVGDYVFAALTAKEELSVEVAEKLNIKVTKTTSDNIFVGDTKYFGFTTLVKPADFSFNSTYTVYTDGTFIARKAVDSTEAVSVENIALATYVDTNLKQIKLIRANGDEDIFTYSNGSDDATMMTSIKNGAPVMVKISVESNGRVNISQLKDDGATIAADIAAFSEYDDDDKFIKYDGVSYYLDESSRIFVKADNGTGAYSKADIKGWPTEKATTGVAYANADAKAFSAVVYRTTASGYRYVVAAFVDATGNNKPAGASTSKIVFMTANADKWTTTDGAFFSIKGYCDGASVEYTSKKNVSAPVDAEKFSWVKVDLDGDGLIKSQGTLIGGKKFGTPFIFADPGNDINSDSDYLDSGEWAPVDNAGNMIIGAVKAYDSGYKTVTLYDSYATETSGSEHVTLKVDSDTKYYLMSGSGVMSAASFSDLATADFAKDNYYTNCFYKAKADRTAEIIVIMATNRCSSIDNAFQWNVGDSVPVPNP